MAWLEYNWYALIGKAGLVWVVFSWFGLGSIQLEWIVYN